MASPLTVLTSPPFTLNTTISFKISIGDAVGWEVQRVDVDPPVAVTIPGNSNPSNVANLGPWPAAGEYRVTILNNSKNPPSTTVTIGAAIEAPPPPC